MGIIRKGMKSYLIKLGKLLLLLVPGLFLSLQHVVPAPAADTELHTDQKTDLDTGAIEPTDSVENNPDLLYVLELLLRAPVTQLKDGEPPYDQEPPDAQDDFRIRVEPPVPTEPPVPPPVPTEPPQPPPLPTEPPSFPSKPPVLPAFPDNPPPDNTPPDNTPPNDPRPPRPRPFSNN